MIIKDIKFMPFGRLYILDNGVGVESTKIIGNPVKGQSIKMDQDGNWHIADGTPESCEV